MRETRVDFSAFGSLARKHYDNRDGDKFDVEIA